MSATLNERIKAAVSGVRQPGECVEVFWQGDAGPWDQALHGAWDGTLASISELRPWLKKHGPDGRTVTIYCAGEYQDLTLS